ncbi:MAG TPA: ATP-binding protein [Thermoanaerobaculia bacterium]|nr:ATP-binding protein [Thermoanaerobaculia bacterium]
MRRPIRYLAVMPETGGTTTQSGILYQNSITALYLGRLIDPTERTDTERIAFVRAEAWEDVDDTVVGFGDGHAEYIQAKEAIADDAWSGLWKDFLAQFRGAAFGRGRDRLVLVCGDPTERVRGTREAAGRARGAASAVEWYDRLSEVQRALVQNISQRTGAHDPGEVFVLFRHVFVEITSLAEIERDRIPFWVPQNTLGTAGALFSILRDQVGGNARWRIAFDRESLLDKLRTAMPAFRIAHAIPMAEIESSVRRCNALLEQHKATLGDTGVHCERPVTESIVEWLHSDESRGTVTMLLDQAGAGKTVVMRDVKRILDAAGHQVIAVKADLQLADAELPEDVEARLQLPDTFERVVERLASRGPVFVLLDQIDALSLALAHNERTLSLLLDLVARVCSIPAVRVLMSCRLFDSNNDPRLRRFQTARRFTIGDLSEAELVAVLKSAGIDPLSLPKETLELLRVPLHLDLFLLTRGAGYGAASLQDLYRTLLEDIALRAAPDAPPRKSRADTLIALMRGMQAAQRTSVADQNLAEEMLVAATWLASHGILVRASDGWAFRHQTMLAYLFAADFVQRDVSVVVHLREGAQGLTARTELLHILQHLRGKNPIRALREVNDICGASDIRFHLRDLTVRWFAALPRPVESEVAWADALLQNPRMRSRFWAAAHGNPVWFDELRDPIEDALSVRDEDGERVLQYIGSIAVGRQREVATLFVQLLRRDSRWTHAIAAAVSGWYGWNDPTVLPLIEELFRRGLPLPNLMKFEQFVLANPDVAIPLLIASVKRDQELEKEFDLEEMARSLSFKRGITMSLADIGPGPLIHPTEWLDSIVPWLEKKLAGTPDDVPDTFHASDEVMVVAGRIRLPSGPDQEVYRKLLHGVCVALIALRERGRKEFVAYARRFGASRSVRIQECTAVAMTQHYYNVGLNVGGSAQGGPALEPAAEFLLSNARRLSFDSVNARGVVSLVLRKGDSETIRRVRRTLIEEIAREPDREKRRNRLQLLRKELRTASMLKRVEIDAPKIPDRPLPQTEEPIEAPFEWRAYMVGAEKSENHHEQLRSLRRAMVADPAAFLEIFRNVPADIDQAFVRTFIEALPETQIAFDAAYEVLKRFLSFTTAPTVPAAFAWWVQKRSERMPGDLFDFLESWVRNPLLEMAGDSANVQPVHYLRSDRGASFLAFMRLLRVQKGDASMARRWSLFEYVATEGTCPLKAAAIAELIPELVVTRTKALDLFDRLMTAEDEKSLLHAPRLVPFLQAAIWQSFSRVVHYLIELCESDDTTLQGRGAQLLAIAATSPAALSQKELFIAQRLLETVVTGEVAHRWNACRLLARAVDRDLVDYCLSVFERLLDDPDATVRSAIGEVFAHLGKRDLIEREDFLVRFASSPALYEGIQQLGEFLLGYGLAAPDVALSVIMAILSNDRVMRQPQWYTGRELIQFVLRVEAFPASTSAQRLRAMDVFDALMEQYAGVAADVLVAWDRQ